MALSGDLCQRLGKALRPLLPCWAWPEPEDLHLDLRRPRPFPASLCSSGFENSEATEPERNSPQRHPGSWSRGGHRATHGAGAEEATEPPTKPEWRRPSCGPQAHPPVMQPWPQRGCQEPICSMQAFGDARTLPRQLSAAAAGTQGCREKGQASSLRWLPAAARTMGLGLTAPECEPRNARLCYLGHKD